MDDAACIPCPVRTPSAKVRQLYGIYISSTAAVLDDNHCCSYCRQPLRSINKKVLFDSAKTTETVYL